ncbi:MAG TPA: hypothetical protein DCG47_15375 [Spirochaetaceae bacterium]|nr:hypothetical protein [Spirochaetaceae bacterium]
MKSKEAPRYYCQHCGAEVGRDEKACPKCGRLFTSVLCPKCGFSAAPSRFKEGCPVCGHTGALNAPGYDGGAEAWPPRKGPQGPAAPLPLWIWLLALGILAFASIGLVSALL